MRPQARRRRLRRRLRQRLGAKPPGYRFSVWRVLLIYGGFMLVVVLSVLDQTIIATALPHIVADVGGAHQYVWLAAWEARS